MPFDDPLTGNAAGSLKSLFEYRKNYDTISIPEISEAASKELNGNYVANVTGKVPFVDTYYKHSLYGIIDFEGDIIKPVSENYGFIEVANLNNAGGYKLINFVADAYLAMRDYMRLILYKDVGNENSNLINLNITKAYSSPMSTVGSWYKIYAVTFRQQIINDKAKNSKIKNHYDFVKYFTTFLKKQLILNRPISASSIMINRYFFDYSSGLMFDIAKDLASSDEIKVEKYLLSPEFKQFQNVCRRFGFSIDIRVPWRLIADLESPAMKPYLEKYSVYNTQDVFDQYYTKVFSTEIENLKYLYHKAYLVFLLQNNIASNDLNDLTYEDLLKQLNENFNFFTRLPVSKEKFFQDFPDHYWLKLHAYFLNYETKRGLTQQQFDNIIREANGLLASNIENKNFLALKYINNYFKSFNSVKYYADLVNANKSSEELDDVSNEGLPNIII